MILVDTNVLVAIAFRDLAHHAQALELFAEVDDDLGVLPTVIAETCYLLERKIGPRAEAAFLESFDDDDFELMGLEPADLVRMAHWYVSTPT